MAGNLAAECELSWMAVGFYQIVCLCLRHSTDVFVFVFRA
jgi:hypothetical protein